MKRKLYYSHNNLLAKSKAQPKIPIAIGDIHGSFHTLQQLLHEIDHSPAHDAPLWFVGDMLNRGPRSLETLEKIIALGKRAIVILGNHELHLLAVASGNYPFQHNDTFNDILNSPISEILINYLRKQKICFYDRGFLMVHAGLFPTWSIEDALFLSEKISLVLSSNNWRSFFDMHGKTFINYQPIEKIIENDFSDKNHLAKLQMASSILTRIRYIGPNGLPNWHIKSHPKNCPYGYIPWFYQASSNFKASRIVFGHWSKLGLINRDHLICVDTGCAWGNCLTAIQLSIHPNQRAIWQVPYSG